MPRQRICECGECRTCRRREYSNEWYRRPGNAEKVRQAVKRYREENADVVRQKDRERGYRLYDEGKVKARRKARRLERQPCEVCGRMDSQRHHPDYSKPFEVLWLCTKHHGELHRVIV